MGSFDVRWDGPALLVQTPTGSLSEEQAAQYRALALAELEKAPARWGVIVDLSAAAPQPPEAQASLVGMMQDREAAGCQFAILVAGSTVMGMQVRRLAGEAHTNSKVLRSMDEARAEAARILAAG